MLILHTYLLFHDGRSGQGNETPTQCVPNKLWVPSPTLHSEWEDWPSTCIECPALWSLGLYYPANTYWNYSWPSLSYGGDTGAQCLHVSAPCLPATPVAEPKPDKSGRSPEGWESSFPCKDKIAISCFEMNKMRLIHHVIRLADRVAAANFHGHLATGWEIHYWGSAGPKQGCSRILQLSTVCGNPEKYHCW